MARYFIGLFWYKIFCQDILHDILRLLLLRYSIMQWAGCVWIPTVYWVPGTKMCRLPPDLQQDEKADCHGPPDLHDEAYFEHGGGGCPCLDRSAGSTGQLHDEVFIKELPDLSSLSGLDIFDLVSERYLILCIYTRIFYRTKISYTIYQ